MAFRWLFLLSALSPYTLGWVSARLVSWVPLEAS